jgi:uncharacterized protein YmfQ (DUF2313 family)
MADDRHIRRTGEQYSEAFEALLPVGAAWPREPDTALMAFVLGLSEIWGTPVDSRAADLLERETDPRATVEMLPDWLRNWGLPDPCVKAPTSMQEWRNALIAKMTMLGGQSREFYISVAESLGYSITITEYLPYQCGISRVGDTRSALDNPQDPTRYMWQLGPPEIRYYWTVHVNALKLTYFRTGISQTGVDRLLAIGVPEDLICVLDRIKPAHTDIVYDFSALVALDFMQDYNSQYIALGVP